MEGKPPKNRPHRAAPFPAPGCWCILFIMTTTQALPDEERLTNAANSLQGVGWAIQSRSPGRIILGRPKIQYPIGLFLLLTVITLGAFIIIWVPLAYCVPRYCRMTLTITDGQLIQARKWSYS